MRDDIVEAYAQANSRLLLLDYDGTLVPLKPTPPEAKPTPALLGLLEQLASSPRNRVVAVSGRDHESLGDWLGDLTIDLAAEHGLFIKEHAKPWRMTHHPKSDWKAQVMGVLEQAVRSTPGSMIETKTASLVWHYRNAGDPRLADHTYHELKANLAPIAESAKLKILDSHMAVEVKLAGVDKGTVARHWLDQREWGFILAAGDDTTDEDLFRAMPDSAFTVKIGDGHTAANTRLRSAMSFRALLRTLAKSP